MQIPVPDASWPHMRVVDVASRCAMVRVLGFRVQLQVQVQVQVQVQAQVRNGVGHGSWAREPLGYSFGFRVQGFGFRVSGSG